MFVHLGLMNGQDSHEFVGHSTKISCYWWYLRNPLILKDFMELTLMVPLHRADFDSLA